MISIDQVKDLRDKTGVSIMQCRKALEEANGDEEKALLILKKASSEAASKRSERATGAGRVVVKTSGDKVAMSAVLCETDFVAKNDDFIKLADFVVNKALEKGENGFSAESEINEVIQKTGENVKLGDVVVREGGNIGTYVHNDSLGSFVVLEGGTPELAKDIAMHVAAMKPSFISREDISEEEKEKVRSFFAEEVAKEDKPEDIKEKILLGKINNHFASLTLSDQPFVKDADMTVGKLVESAGAKVKEAILVRV